MTHQPELTFERDNTSRRSPTALIIPVGHWQLMLDHLKSALPNEGCGLLACADTDHGVVRVTHLYPGRNVLESPTRFRMDDGEVVDAHRHMREHGLRLAAIVHSHPISPPTLSRTDLREAYYPEAALLIVSFLNDPPDAVAWRLERSADGWAPATIPVQLGPT